MPSMKMILCDRESAGRKRTTRKIGKQATFPATQTESTSTVPSFLPPGLKLERMDSTRSASTAPTECLDSSSSSLGSSTLWESCSFEPCFFGEKSEPSDEGEDCDGESQFIAKKNFRKSDTTRRTGKDPTFRVKPSVSASTVPSFLPPSLKLERMDSTRSASTAATECLDLSSSSLGSSALWESCSFEPCFFGEEAESGDEGEGCDGESDFTVVKKDFKKKECIKGPAVAKRSSLRSRGKTSTKTERHLRSSNRRSRNESLPRDLSGVEAVPETQNESFQSLDTFFSHTTSPIVEESSTLNGVINSGTSSSTDSRSTGQVLAAKIFSFESISNAAKLFSPKKRHRRKAQKQEIAKELLEKNIVPPLL